MGFQALMQLAHPRQYPNQFDNQDKLIFLLGTEVRIFGMNSDEGYPALVQYPQPTPKADYRYRVILDQEEFTAFMLKLSTEVDYPNFKNAVKDHDYHAALADVWGVMYGYQER